MRCVCLVAALLFLSACAGAPVADTTCPEPRPQVCTMEFNPACAVLRGGGRKEFASPCTACADPEVSGYTSGPCPK